MKIYKSVLHSHKGERGLCFQCLSAITVPVREEERWQSLARGQAAEKNRSLPLNKQPKQGDQVIAIADKK